MEIFAVLDVFLICNDEKPACCYKLLCHITFFRFGVHKWSIKKIVCMFLFKSVMNDDREKTMKIRDKLSSYKMPIICANVPHNS